MGKVGLISAEWKYYALGVVVFAITMLLMVSLLTDNFVAGEQVGRPIDGMLSVRNMLGPVGAFVAGSLAFVAGDASHLIYAITFIWVLILFSQRPLDRLPTRLAGLTILVGAVSGILHMGLSSGWSNSAAGGAFGGFMAERLLLPYFGRVGAVVMGGMLALLGLLLATDFLFVHLLLYAQRVAFHLFHWVVLCGAACLGMGGGYRRWRTSRRLARVRARVTPRPSDASPLDEPPEVEAPEFPPASRSPWSGAPVEPAIHIGRSMPPSPPKPAAPPEPVSLELPFDEVPDETEPGAVPQARDAEGGGVDAMDEMEDSLSMLRGAAEDPEPGTRTVFASGAEDGAKAAGTPPARSARVTFDAPAPRPVRRKTAETDELPDDYVYPKRYTLPPLEMFHPPECRVIPNLTEKLRHTSMVLEETLRTFGIEARVTDVTRGPTITRFELEPAPGIKVSRFLALTDDIALALEATGVRVEAPIPGKARVGIEASNDERDPVVIRELLEHRDFTKGKGKLNLALGKGISGGVCIADLTRMPHLLVAGATGAGKTVCVKSLLASLLLQHTPDELQLMLIDPKMVELSIFNDIPHLITPVVTEAKKAATALTWLISEMDERYRLFAHLRVRNIEVYNESVENGEIELEGGAHGGQSVNVVRKLPYIVCIIDELADLMMLARAEVEDCIARLAQLARAVGIHLIIATQRPSVDVITGVIKANFPTRVSFQVSSRVDSRCILDEIGAERLIGMGDMLYLPAGQSKPDRIQGAFVGDDEMNALVSWLKRQAPPQYRDEIERFGRGKDTQGETPDEDDPLFPDAVRVVLETEQASISMVQRRLRVGYTRAARLIDMMEMKGIIGPHTGSKAREILVDPSARDEVA